MGFERVNIENSLINGVLGLAPERFEVNFLVQIALPQCRNIKKHLPSLKSWFCHLLNILNLHLLFLHGLGGHYLIRFQYAINYFSLGWISFFCDGPLTSKPAISVNLKSLTIILWQHLKRRWIFESETVHRSFPLHRAITDNSTKLDGIAILKLLPLLQIYRKACINCDIPIFLSVVGL